MKKSIGISIAIGMTLIGCTKKEDSIRIDPPGGNEFYRDIAPLPLVHMVPSERAAAFKGVDFSDISHRLRFDLAFKPYEKKFKKIRLLLVDYTILPHKNPVETPYKKKIQGQTYLSQYKNKPKRYYMTISFYECDKGPPLPPFFEGTVSMDVNTAPPHEALQMMAHEIIVDYLHSPYKKVYVSMD
ncbi:MAG: hypothetical protein KBD90_03160 [Alphaproteobacteria bacterium]|nr:hypothetical protein [Alphaproteobacteria bacterium]